MFGKPIQPIPGGRLSASPQAVVTQPKPCDGCTQARNFSISLLFRVPFDITPEPADGATQPLAIDNPPNPETGFPARWAAMRTHQ